MGFLGIFITTKLPFRQRTIKLLGRSSVKNAQTPAIQAEEILRGAGVKGRKNYTTLYFGGLFTGFRQHIKITYQNPY
jgi:hypothetical protein